MIGDVSTPPAEQPPAASGTAAAGRRCFRWAVAISVLLVAGSGLLAVALPDQPTLLTVRLAMIFCLFLGGGT